jgi:hypothetical protein
MIKAINQIAIFFLEIVMLISYGYFGFTQPLNFITRLLFAIVIVFAAIALWAIFAAPKSRRRLEMPYLIIFRASMFFVAALFVFLTGYKNFAITLAALTIITQTISYFTEP